MLKLAILGNLGADPELRYSAQGVPVLQFNVAGNYRTRNADGDSEERTEWVRVRVIGNRAEGLAEYLKKGQKVYCDGRLEPRPWVTNQNELRAGLELLADSVEFAGGNPAEAGSVQADLDQRAQPAAAQPAAFRAPSPSQAPASQTAGRPPAGARAYARGPQQQQPTGPRQGSLDDLDDVPF